MRPRWMPLGFDREHPMNLFPAATLPFPKTAANLGAEYAQRCSAPAFPRRGTRSSSLCDRGVQPCVQSTETGLPSITKRYASFRRGLQDFAAPASEPRGRGYFRSRLRKNSHIAPAVRCGRLLINCPANTNQARGLSLRWSTNVCGPTNPQCPSDTDLGQSRPCSHFISQPKKGVSRGGH